MEKIASSYYLPPFKNEANGDIIVETSQHGVKKLKLFGIELDPSSNLQKEIKFKRNFHDSVECDESVNSSSSSSTISSLGGGGGGADNKLSKESSSSTTEPPLPRPPLPEEGKDKLECQYCFKRFPNSQALGGHQNAHKKERLRKRRLQLQARKASINHYYLQPYQNNPTFNYHVSSPWLYDSSTTHQAPGFTLFEESNISFNHHENQERWCLPFHHHQQEDRNMFTLSQPDEHRDSTKLPRIVNQRNPNNPSFNNSSKQNCKPFDLQLGLSFSSISEM